MTSNPLNLRRYAINAVVADVGWITDQEKASVAACLTTDAIVHFTTDFHELHLYWPILNASWEDALNEARGTLRQAVVATGVTCPHIRSFQVAEIGQ